MMVSGYKIQLLNNVNFKQTLLVAAQGVEGAVQGVDGAVEGEAEGVTYVTREDGQVFY